MADERDVQARHEPVVEVVVVVMMIVIRGSSKRRRDISLNTIM